VAAGKRFPGGRAAEGAGWSGQPVEAGAVAEVVDGAPRLAARSGEGIAGAWHTESSVVITDPAGLDEGRGPVHPSNLAVHLPPDSRLAIDLLREGGVEKAVFTAEELVERITLVGSPGPDVSGDAAVDIVARGEVGIGRVDEALAGAPAVQRNLTGEGRGRDETHGAVGDCEAAEAVEFGGIPGQERLSSVSATPSQAPEFHARGDARNTEGADALPVPAVAGRMPIVGVDRASAAIRRAARATLAGLANTVTAVGGGTTAAILRAKVAILAVAGVTNPVTTEPLVWAITINFTVWRHRHCGGYGSEEGCCDQTQAQREQELPDFKHLRLLLAILGEGQPPCC